MYVLSVTPEEIEIIGEGLDELKFKRVGALVENLRKQIASQLPGASIPVSEPVVPPMVMDPRVDEPIADAA